MPHAVRRDPVFAVVLLLLLLLVELGLVAEVRRGIEQSSSQMIWMQMMRVGQSVGFYSGGSVRDFAHERADLVEVRRGLLSIVLVTALRRVGHRSQQTAVLRLVFLEVAVQIGLLAEAAFAHGTLEGSLLVVDVAHVALQVARYAEAALAVLALVRLFARVGAQMARQIG